MSKTIAPVTESDYLKAYRVMLLSRVLEEKLASLYRAGMIKGGVFLGRGQEALSTATGIHLRKGDIFAPLIRDQAGRLAFGDTVLDTLRTYLGSQLGSMRGRDGNIHRGRPREGYYAMISHLGAMVPAVAGGLLARRLRGESGVVGATCLGDGGTSTGAFHEGLNAAAVDKLPLVVVVANNQYAYSTLPTKPPTSGATSTRPWRSMASTRWSCSSPRPSTKTSTRCSCAKSRRSIPDPCM
jgi:pyruvate dehydrogenase E1 component alpha subunit/2-oxoisovalerate dehydrogenase E1 component alpha subunit